MVALTHPSNLYLISYKVYSLRVKFSVYIYLLQESLLFDEGKLEISMSLMSSGNGNGKC